MKPLFTVDDVELYLLSNNFEVNIMFTSLLLLNYVARDVDLIETTIDYVLLK